MDYQRCELQTLRPLHDADVFKEFAVIRAREWNTPETPSARPTHPGFHQTSSPLANSIIQWDMAHLGGFLRIPARFFAYCAGFIAGETQNLPTP